jgi:hypothetical protein
VEAGVLAEIFASPARFTSVLPVVAERIDLPRQPDPRPSPGSEHSPAPETRPFAQTDLNPLEPTPASDSPQHQSVEGLISQVIGELDCDYCFRKHSAFVKQHKCQRFYKEVGGMLVMLLGSALALGYGVFGFLNNWTVPGKLLAIIGGAILGLIALTGLAASLGQMFKFPDTRPANSIAEACTAFYRTAFTHLKDGLGYLIDVGQYFPTSVLERFAGVSGDNARLPIQWRDVLETHAAVDATVRVDEVTTALHPREDVRVVDVTVTLRGIGFDNLSFRNLAICSQGKWFLLTPEPWLVGAANGYARQ